MNPTFRSKNLTIRHSSSRSGATLHFRAQAAESLVGLRSGLPLAAVDLIRADRERMPSKVGLLVNEDPAVRQRRFIARKNAGSLRRSGSLLGSEGGTRPTRLKPRA